MDEIKLNDDEVALNPILVSYMKLGWVFYRDEWVNGHNGNPEVDYKFSSPRMTKPAALYSIARFKGQEALTKAKLLDAESGVLASRLVEVHENALKDGLRAKLVSRLRRCQKLQPNDIKVKTTFTIKP